MKNLTIKHYPNYNNLSEYAEKYLIKRNFKSDHYKFNVPSSELNEYLDELLETANDLSIFFRENNLNFSICAGLMIGFFTIGGFLPWDDDIDIVVEEKGINFLIDYYENKAFNISEDLPFPIASRVNQKHWKAKGIYLNDKKYYFLKMLFGKDYFFKIIHFNSCVQNNNNDIGGIDIIFSVLNTKDGLYYEKHSPKTIICNPNDNNCIMGNISGTYLPFVEINNGAGIYLDKRYGKQWRSEIRISH